MKSILKFGELATQALEEGANLTSIASLEVKSKITKAAFINEKEFEYEIKKLNDQMSSDIKKLVGG